MGNAVPSSVAPTNPAQNFAAQSSNHPIKSPQLPPQRPPIGSTYSTPPLGYVPTTLDNANYRTSTVTGVNLPVSLNNNTTQQNIVNNNQAQVSQQRKPMYPINPQLPPITQQHHQHQQPYSAAYNYSQQQNVATPQTQPGMFNGQPTAGPLHYQNQQQQHQQQHLYQAPQPGQYSQEGSVLQHGFNRLWGHDTIDLMQNRHILSPATLAPSKIVLHNQFHESINCNPK